MATAARTISRTAPFFSRRTPTVRNLTCQYRFTSPPNRFFATSLAQRAGAGGGSSRGSRQEDAFVLPPYSHDLLDPDEKSMYEMMSPEDREIFDQNSRAIADDYANPQKREPMISDINQMVYDIDKEIPMPFNDTKPKVMGFWGEDEDDEFAWVEDNDDEFKDDDIASIAHAELDQHREIREYARIAAWDMPLLSKLAKPFSLPEEDRILRFRYTNYMGESHPAETKVVVEFCSKDLTPKYLTEEQRVTLLKLVGTRYDPSKDIIRMSTEKFPSRAQNKRYLGDQVDTLITEAKEGDSFKDVPLDLRHHKKKPKPKFPESWALTEERKKQLLANREQMRIAQEERPAIVDGNEIIQEAILKIPALSTVLVGAGEVSKKERLAGKGQKMGKKMRR
ncbi:28S ribosomal protein S35, mitochondrial [Arachnomyces sp. PD_36]|nr:28S ribosomal protein S35, mitochondrial [Arachnomyces sp. PD_36]